MQITEITVTLRYIEPKVSRRLEVPADIPLDQLHQTLQAAFGWHNTHLYQFCIGKPYQMGAERWVMPDFVESPEDLPADKTTLAQVMKKNSTTQLTYLYDFGDDWEHQIKIGTTHEADPDLTYPRLSTISGNCPPEDIGGPPGYELFVEAMADPKHPEHKEFKTWYGGIFNPHAPNETALRNDVKKLARTWN